MVSSCQLPPDSGNQRHIPDSSPHRHPTRILSHNHDHRMCICEDMGSLQPMHLTFIHTDSTFQWFYSVNFRQTPAIRDISRTQVHTGTPHVFCLTITTIAGVFVKIWADKHRQILRSYTQTQHFSGFILSTSARLRQSERYPGLKSTQVPHTYSVTQRRPSHVYL